MPHMKPTDVVGDDRSRRSTLLSYSFEPAEFIRKKADRYEFCDGFGTLLIKTQGLGFCMPARVQSQHSHQQAS
jgi:hypothetical protein